MKVIFIKSVAGKGNAGEIKDIKSGYAYNFLIPQGYALPATPGAIKQAELKIRADNIRKEIDQEKLAELAEQIEGQTLHFKARSGAGERLFGSITAAAIAEELSKNIDTEIDKRKIQLDKALREVGEHQVTIHLSKDLEPKIIVTIEQEQA